MKQIENFVKNTFKNYPKDKREELIQSITEMLTEKVEDLMEKGFEEQAAIDKTVLEFGTIEDYDSKPVKINRKLKRQKSLRHYKNDMIFSSIGTLIIIGMLIFSNLTYTEGVIWFVLPGLAVLWWPLATLYRYLNKSESVKEKKDE